MKTQAQPFTFTTTHNGAFVTITRTHDGRTQFLQGDSAREFMNEAATTHPGYTDSDLCRVWWTDATESA